MPTGAESRRSAERRPSLGPSPSCGGAVTGRPLVSEDGEFQLVAPTAFESFVLHQVRFESHPEPGGQSGRGTVAGVDPGVDPVESEFVEGQMQQSMDRVGVIAVAGEGRMEDVADLAPLVFGGWARPT